MEKLCRISHSITRYRITTEAFRVANGHGLATRDGFWRNVQQMDRLAFASAHKRILQRLRSA
jgi:hypothetical protein